MDIGQIMEFLPHRYPFLLIDRVVEIERSKRIVAIKNVTINEPFFAGHFPGYPMMPGVLVVEAMAQAGCILLLSEVANREDKLVLFTGIENAKFRRQVTPGDQLRIEVNVLSFRPRQGRMEGRAYLGRKAGVRGYADLRGGAAWAERRLSPRASLHKRELRSEHPSQRGHRGWSGCA